MINQKTWEEAWYQYDQWYIRHAKNLTTYDTRKKLEKIVAKLLRKSKSKRKKA